MKVRNQGKAGMIETDSFLVKKSKKLNSKFLKLEIDISEIKEDIENIRNNIPEGTSIDIINNIPEGTSIDIIDDLTTGGIDKALSAEQGKNLNELKLSKAIPVSYQDLVILIQNDNLVFGQSYIITDYQTVHIISNTEDINTGEIEPLLVTAVSTNKLASEAHSLLYPQDIIYYEVTNDQTVVAGCTKGYIYRRIDTKQNNDIPFDFRQVKFRRWQISQPTWNSSETYNRGSVVKSTFDNTLWMSIVDNNLNNPTNNSNYWRQFEFDNLTYISPFAETWNRSGDYTFVLTCTINYQDYKMWVNASDYDSAFNNKLDSTINNLLNNLNSVIFGTNFYGNSIGAGFNNNSIGTGFNNNSIGTGFSNNSIGAYFNNNSIGAYFNNNGGLDFTNATYVYLSYNKELFINSEMVKLLRYYDEDNVLQIVAANA